MTRQHQFLWLDLETTGLDPHAGYILEFAAVLAADDAEGYMSIVEEHQSVVRPPGPVFVKGQRVIDGEHDGSRRAVPMIEMDPFVQEMHTKNGLLAELANPELCCSLQEADEFLANLVPGNSRISLAGNSVHFDLAWVRVHMPTFAKKLSHRVFDVSTLKLAERSWFDATFYTTEDRTPAHRALDDVKASLAAAKAWREVHETAKARAERFLGAVT